MEGNQNLDGTFHSQPLKTGADRAAAKRNSQQGRTVEPGVSVGTHAEERLSEAQENRLQVHEWDQMLVHIIFKYLLKIF